MGLVHGLLTSLSIGLADLFGRRVASARGPIVAGAAIQFVAISTSLVAVLVVDSRFDGGDLRLGLLSGVGLGCGLWGYFAGLQRATSAIIAPLVAAMSAVIPYAYALVRGAEPGLLGVLGAFVAFAGIVVVTAGGGPIHHVAEGLKWGVFSGFGFGIGLAVVIDVGDDSGAWPAVGQRIGALSLMLVVAAVIKVRPVPPRSLRLWALLAGIAAGCSTIFFLLGVRADPTSAVVAGQLFPAVTVLVGHYVYGDQLRARQVAGVGVAILGVILIALG